MLKVWRYINTRDQSNVKGVEDRSNTPKGCNAMYVKDVEDVKDRSNTPKGCNAMYVEDVKDGKRTYRHTFIIPFLIWYHLNVILCMSKMSKMRKEHTDTFWLITSLIIYGFSIRKKFWKAEKIIFDIFDMLRHT